MRPVLINEESDHVQPSLGNLAASLILPPSSPYGVDALYFEMYTRGTQFVDWTARTAAACVDISQKSGRLSPEEEDQRIEVIFNWGAVPGDLDEGVLMTSIEALATISKSIYLLRTTICFRGV